MIQDPFWRTAFRWAWLIIACGVVLAGAAYLAGSRLVDEPGDRYSATTTLGVSRVISPGGIVTASGDSENADAINRFATSLIQWTSTPQFTSRVEERLRSDGLDPAGLDVDEAVRILPEPDIPATAATVNVRPIPAQSISISASAADELLAGELAGTAARILRQKAADDERLLRNSILADAERTRADLLQRLNTTYQSLNVELRAVGNPALQTALLALQDRGPLNQPTSAQFAAIVQDLARASNNPNLIYLQSQARALEQELAGLGERVERLQAEAVGQSEPLIVTAQPETAVTQAAPLVSRRDLVATGAVCGLLLGWLVANIAEQARMARNESRQARHASELLGGRA